MLQNNNGILIIHLDVANFTPELTSPQDLEIYFSALDSLCREISKNHKGKIKKIAYFEGSFLKSSLYDKPKLGPGKWLSLFYRLVGAFQRLPNIERYIESLPYIILDLFSLKGYETRIAPKEAEQMIPDEILKSEENVVHAVLTDDKARDSTICKIRVVHSKHRAKTILSLGIAEQVYALEDLADTNYLLCWLLSRMRQESVEPCHSLEFRPDPSSLVSYDSVNLSTDFEAFTTNDLRRFLIYFISQSDEKLKQFFNVVDSDLRLAFFLKTVITRLASEPTLLRHLWRRLRHYPEITSLISLRELDSYFIELLPQHSGQIIRLEHELEERRITLAQLQRIKGTEEDLKAKINEINLKINEIKKLEKEFSDLSTILAVEQNKENELKEKLNELSKKFADLRKLNRNREVEINKIKKDIEELERKIKLKDEEIIKLKDIHCEKKKIFEDINKKIEVVNTEVERLQNKLDEYKREYEEINSKKCKLENSIVNYKKDIEEIKKYIETLDDEIRSVQNEIDKLKELLEQKRKQLMEKVKELEHLKAELREYENKEAELREEETKLEKLKELKALAEKIETFKRNVNEYERVINIDENYKKIKNRFEELKMEFTELLKSIFEDNK